MGFNSPFKGLMTNRERHYAVQLYTATGVTYCGLIR